jgi:hypothetical protein
MTYPGQQILLAPNADDTLEKLRQDGFKYVLIDNFPPPAAWRTSYPLTQDSFIAQHLHLLYANNYVYLYELVDTPVRDASTTDSADPNFSALHAGGSTPWKQFGPAAAENSACDGVTIMRGGGYLQTFEATPGALYQFQADMDTTTNTPGSAALEISWTRRNTPSGALSIELQPLTTSTATYTMSSTAPDDAMEGAFYVGSFDDDGVCVREASAKHQATPD